MDMDAVAASSPLGIGELEARLFGAGPRYGAAKRAMDVGVAVVLLLLLAPLMLAIWVVVRCDGGPGFFAHRRVGYDYRSFRCLKFRTMRVDADVALRRLLASDARAAEEWRTTRKLADDPRITRIGRMLRSTSLDELPQLFNVLRGEMSLVGPRPVVLAELADHYAAERRDAYVSVRPGMTGLWQVSGRNHVGYARRTELDAQYARVASLRTDVHILCRTVSVVLTRAGAY